MLSKSLCLSILCFVTLVSHAAETAAPASPEVQAVQWPSGEGVCTGEYSYQEYKSCPGFDTDADAKDLKLTGSESQGQMLDGCEVQSVTALPADADCGKPPMCDSGKWTGKLAKSER